MCGESAPAMTQRGKHAYVRSARNEVRPKRMRAFVLRLVGEPLGGEKVKGWNPCSKQTFHEDCLLSVEAVLRLVKDLAGVLLKDF